MDFFTGFLLGLIVGVIGLVSLAVFLKNKL